ncbi:MAG: DUF1688 family protein [Alphaproteobacteria bacterium]
MAREDTGLGDDARAAVRLLRAPATIRARSAQIFAHILSGRSEHFLADVAQLDRVAEFVIETTRASYPDLAIPYHSRWRHFETGGTERWRAIRDAAPDAAERGRIAYDLVIPSVLLDAGAGPVWRFVEPGGAIYARSEGLAVASFRAFADGLFSADPSSPWRADGAALASLDSARLAGAFQVRADNPLSGLDGRAELVRRLGAAVLARPDIFAGRLGGLFDHLCRQAQGRRLGASAVLGTVLEVFSSIWPGRLALGGENLGDVWRHAAARGPGASDFLVPFHKLSQWLAYSLVEPLEWAEIAVHGLDELTGLPEYRNGGLFLDMGALVLRDRRAGSLVHAVGSPLVVEWRAATVVLLDRVAARVRARLGLGASALPLAKVLQGGTWAAGRAVARRRRPDGAPPLVIDSDGTVF